MQKEREVWLPVVGFEGKYKISSYGRCLSLNYNRTKKEKILKLCVSGKYFFVNLAKYGFNYPYRIHSLVCTAFHGSRPSKKHQVAHYDGNSKNNHISNLRWATQSENENDKIMHGKSNIGERCGSAILSTEDVKYIRKNFLRTGYKKSNAKELAEKFNTKIANIWQIIHRKTWKHI